MIITKEHIDLMEHTMKNGNWFGANYNTNDYKLFEELFLNGFVSKSKTPGWIGDDVFYHLTGKGNKYLKGEIKK